jgi:integral membrane protein
MLYRIAKAYANFRPFTPHEAWALFRIAAIAEAVGWTLLILGILMREVLLPGNELGVQIGGRVHGVLYLAYFATLVWVWPSLRWSWWRLILGILGGIPPYASVIFERLTAHYMLIDQARQLYRVSLLRLLSVK